jgi:hypothetical protein
MLIISTAFLKQALKGERKLLRLKDVRSLVVPQFEEVRHIFCE